MSLSWVPNLTILLNKEILNKNYKLPSGKLTLSNDRFCCFATAGSKQPSPSDKAVGSPLTPPTIWTNLIQSHRLHERWIQLLCDIMLLGIVRWFYLWWLKLSGRITRPNGFNWTQGTKRHQQYNTNIHVRYMYTTFIKIFNFFNAY